MIAKKDDTLNATETALEKALTQSSVTHDVYKKKSRVVVAQHSYSKVAQTNTSAWKENSLHKKPR